MVAKQALSAIKIKNIKTSGFYADGGGLYLQVTGKGAKSWVYRFMLNKRRRDMGLGSLEALSLAEARMARTEQKKLISQGIDPIEYRNAKKANQAIAQSKLERESISFKECAEEYIEVKAAEWKNAKHKQQWSNTLRDYAYPVMGSISVVQVDQAAVLKCLKPIWTKKTETAKRVRQRVEAILDYAKAKSYRTGDNPAAWKGGLEPLLPKPNKIKEIKHHKALHYDKLPSFISQLRAQDGLGPQALRFLILTGARTGDVRGAKWEEIDLKKKIWIVPKERMKAGEEHRVPLSQIAIDLLEALPRLDEYVFPGQTQGKPLSDGAMTATLSHGA